MKPFLNTDQETQDVINRRYEITNPNNTFVDSKGTPFERISNAYVSCTLKPNAIVGGGFHNAELRKNQ